MPQTYQPTGIRGLTRDMVEALIAMFDKARGGAPGPAYRPYGVVLTILFGVFLMPEIATWLPGVAHD